MDNSMYTTIPPEVEEYNPDYYYEDIEYVEEDYAMIEAILFDDEIDEEEIQQRAEESGVYNVSSEELLEFITAAELKDMEGGI